MWWQCCILQIYCKSKSKRYTSSAVWEAKKSLRPQALPELWAFGDQIKVHASRWSPSMKIHLLLVLWEHGWKGPLHSGDEQTDSLWQSHMLGLEKGQPNTWTLVSNLQFSFLWVKPGVITHPTEPHGLGGLSYQQLAHCLLVIWRCGVRNSCVTHFLQNIPNKCFWCSPHKFKLT